MDEWCCVDVYANGVNVANWTVGGSSATDTYTATDGDEIEFTWNAGSYDSECSFTIMSFRWKCTVVVLHQQEFSQLTTVNPSCGPPPPPSCHATGTRADGVNVVIDMVDSYGDDGMVHIWVYVRMV